MHRNHRIRLAGLLPALAPAALAGLFGLGALACAPGAVRGPEGELRRIEAELELGRMPWPQREGTWRDDPIWFDGKAEVAIYAATRVLYGEPRRYQAVAYTNSERVDLTRGVKAEGDEGLLAFKHHWSERAPTERYDYRYSTSLYLAREGLGSYKLTASTQEDCGASFKQLERAPGGFQVFESVYFPGAGTRAFLLAQPRAVFEDGLSLALRDLPFGGAPAEFALSVVRSQRDIRRVPFEPEPMRVRLAGETVLETALGPVATHRADLVGADGATRASYWFAADESAPWLRVLVRQEGPDGLRFELESLERDAYWERP